MSKEKNTLHTIKLKEKKKSRVASAFAKVKRLGSRNTQQYYLVTQGQSEFMQPTVEKCKITLDIGGQIFIVAKTTLLMHKGSYFDVLLTASLATAFFVDRSPKYFGLIKHFMRTGTIQTMKLKYKDLEPLKAELLFYKLPVPMEQLKVVRRSNSYPRPRSNSYPRRGIPNALFSGGTILTSAHQNSLAAWLPSKKFTLLYKATNHGFKNSDFHEACDSMGPTLTVIKSKEGHLFGGFTSESWEGERQFKTDPNTFIYTLTNPHDLPPTKYNQKEGDPHSILSDPSHCAVFGSGGDIVVGSNSHRNNLSYTNFSSFVDTTGKGNTTFTGAYCFTTKDIEVFSVDCC